VKNRGETILVYRRNQTENYWRIK